MPEVSPSKSPQYRPEMTVYSTIIRQTKAVLRMTVIPLHLPPPDPSIFPSTLLQANGTAHFLTKQPPSHLSSQATPPPSSEMTISKAQKTWTNNNPDRPTPSKALADSRIYTSHPASSSRANLVYLLLSAPFPIFTSRSSRNVRSCAMMLGNGRTPFSWSSWCRS